MLVAEQHLAASAVGEHALRRAYSVDFEGAGRVDFFEEALVLGTALFVLDADDLLHGRRDD